MKKLTTFFILLFYFSAIGTCLYAQQGRVLVNADFETPVIRDNSYRQLHDSLVRNFNTTASDHLIEIWRAPFLGVTAPSGLQHIEINATQTATLFFEVCMLAGETVEWSFYHKGRSRIDSARLFVEVNGNQEELIRFGTDPTAWKQYSGSYTNTSGSRAVVKFNFESLNSGALGNFIDLVQIVGLSPIVEFENGIYGDLEDVGGNLPRIRVNGAVPAGGLNVAVNIVGGTATAGVDYNVSSNTFNIPEGNYDEKSPSMDISSILSINDDVDAEPTESIEFELANPQSPLIIESVGCATPGDNRIIYRIYDNDASLPIKLVNWQVENESCAFNQLSWTSLSELNHDYYLIEYSNNGTDWQALESVDGAGTSTKPISYQLKHHHNTYEEYYYRLKIVDLAGNIEYSPVTHLRNNCIVERSIRLYPNPVNNQKVNLGIKDYIGSLNIQVIDVNGKVLETIQIDNFEGNTNLDIKNLSKGFYVLKIKGLHFSENQKLIVR